MKPEEAKPVQDAPKQEYEIRKKTKKTSHALGVDSQSYALPQAARKNFYDKEFQWFTEDNGILELKATKNELESFTYELKNNIDSYGNYENYVDPAIRAELLGKLQQTIDWIYGDGQQAAAQAFKARLEEFKKIGVPIKQRFLFRSEFPIYVEQFQNFAGDMNQKLAEKNTLTDQQRSDILSKFTEMESYFNVIKQVLASKQTHEDIGHPIDEVLMKLEAFKQTVNQLFNAPPPKADQKPADQQQ